MISGQIQSDLIEVGRGVLHEVLATVYADGPAAVGFLFAGFASSACNCSRPITIAFPFAAILWSLRRWESVGGVLMAFQFPAYGLLVALAKTRRQRARFALILLAVHAMAVILGLLIYRS
jgi:hypothetical protein